MQYNALQISACQCIANISMSMHCKDQHFNALQRSAIHCITKISLSYHYTDHYCNALQRSAFQCIAKISNSLHYKDQPVNPLHRSLLQCIAKISITKISMTMYCKDQHFICITKISKFQPITRIRLSMQNTDQPANVLQRSACQCITKISLSMHYKDQHCLHKKSHGLQYVDKLN